MAAVYGHALRDARKPLIVNFVSPGTGSDPSNPFEVGSFETTGYGYDVAVSETRAYLAEYPYGLRVIDVSDPFDPSEIGFYETPGLPHDVAVSGGYVYLADFYAGF
ncbi:MAG: hypothetical protein K8R59_04915, partial [Thermoanaerobaculales bacterium]|nr:hypothetical protein [Thermoanaerobaculales bacterium]